MLGEYKKGITPHCIYLATMVILRPQIGLVYRCLPQSIYGYHYNLVCTHCYKPLWVAMGMCTHHYKVAMGSYEHVALITAVMSF